MKEPIWENPEIFAVNKLPYRSTSWPAEREKIEEDSFLYDIDDWRICLDGLWLVRDFDEPRLVPEDIFEKELSPRDSWKETEFPCNFELQGWGTPVYSNQRYPFKVDPPRVMGEPPKNWTYHDKRNPTYCCLREFSLPTDWQKRQIRLYLGAVQSAVYVYINGKEVGYSQNSMSAAEFDLTPFLTERGSFGQPGQKNSIGLKVLTHSDGSYLEDQDFWRLSGVFRNVFLYSLNPVHLEHIQITPHLEEDCLISNFQGRQKGSGIFTVEAHIQNESTDKGSWIGVVQYWDSQKNIWSEPCNKEVSLNPGEEQSITLTLPVNEVETWHPENPSLLTLRVRLYRSGKENHILDTRFFRSGLKATCIRRGVLLHNGAAVKLKGVNRHEHHETRGRALRLKDMQEDIRLMRICNLNAVRCSHYPNHPYWYELCDRHGLFVMDEANMETHELSYHKRELPGDRPEWKAASLDRALSMTLINVNSPSIIIRSLGNEAGYGTNFEAMATLIRELVPGCLIQYADMNIVADFDSQTYPSPSWLEEYIAGTAQRKGEQGQVSHEEQHGPQPTNKPFIMNEYAHAMGNSLGDAFKYWDIIYRHSRLSGGFIWEWCEHGLLKTTTGNRQYYTYGGDYGDEPNSSNFCIDGMVSAGRKPNPSFWEAAHFHRYVDFCLNNEKITITNRFFYTDMKSLTVNWELQKNGETIEKGELPLSGAPAEKRVVDIPSFVNEITNESEFQLFLYCNDPLELHHCLGRASLPLNFIPDSLYSALGKKNSRFHKTHFPGNNEKNGEDTHFSEEKESLIITRGVSQIEISLKSGFIHSFSRDKEPLIKAPLELCFWRDPIDNDRGWNMEKECSLWKNPNLIPESIIKNRNGVRINLNEPAGDIKAELTYELTNRGALKIAMRLSIKEELPLLPRIGLGTLIPQPTGPVKWYGRGPEENYCDRKSGSLPGLYRLSAEKLAPPYVRPQENGQRSDIRFLDLPAESGTSRLTADRRFSFSLRPYEDNQLEQALHSNDLPLIKDGQNKGLWQLHLDLAQMGVGGDNSWGARIHGEYTLPAKNYNWELIWQPFLLK